MREILFRGKQFDTGVWVEGNLIVWEDGSCSIEPGTLDPPPFCVIPETVGQFTGLTDKNGKKIFEGDVVKATIIRDIGYVENIRNEKGVIAFDSLGMIGLMIERTDDNVPVWSDFFCELSISGCIIDYCFEVIGNIHDNPELLEV